MNAIASDPITTLPRETLAEVCISATDYSFALPLFLSKQFRNVAMAELVDEKVALYRAAKSREKHIESLVRTLETNGPMTHDALAKENQMHKSQLTRAMNALGPFGFVAFERLGNTKKYSLTKKGHDFYHYLATNTLSESVPIQLGKREAYIALGGPYGH